MKLKIELVKTPEFLRVCLACAVFASVAWLADYVFAIHRVLIPLSVGTARAVEALLSSLQIGLVREQLVISDLNGFSYQIDFACTGTIPAGLLLVAILASVAPLSHKVAGVLIGVPLTLMLNLVRLVHLFYIGVHYPLAFAWAHSPAWESVMSVFLFAFYSLWRRRVYRLNATYRASKTTSAGI